MVGFHLDLEGDWVAELECGHNQHVRHRPPFRTRPWVLDEAGRASRLGGRLDCPLCEQAEMPDGLRFARRSPEWDVRSLPAALRRAHKLAPGTWGRLVVLDGRLAFSARTEPPIDRVVEAGASQAIPPDVEHEVDAEDGVRLFVEFFHVVPYAERQGAAGTGPD